MDDVERVFRQLVSTLSETDPDRLRAPIEIAEIYQSLIPYRRFRTALRFDTNEDYEMALLRLLAGAGGFVTIDPPEVQQALKEEADERNPNPGAFRDYAAANVYLNVRELTAVADQHRAYAPPEPAPTSPDRWAPPTTTETEVKAPEPPGATMPFVPAGEEEAPPGPTRTPEAARTQPTPACRACGGVLPARDDLRYCPHCGSLVQVPACGRCGADLEPTWSFCVACGAASTPASPG